MILFTTSIQLHCIFKTTPCYHNKVLSYTFKEKLRKDTEMKNLTPYDNYSRKECLNFESKAVHGALGYEPLTGAVSFPIYQTSTFRHKELGVSTGLG